MIPAQYIRADVHAHGDHMIRVERKDCDCGPMILPFSLTEFYSRVGYLRHKEGPAEAGPPVSDV